MNSTPARDSPTASPKPIRTNLVPPETIWNPNEEILRKADQGHTVTHYDMNNRFCHLFMLITCICAVSHLSAAKIPKSGKATAGAQQADSRTEQGDSQGNFGTGQANARTGQAERVYLCAKTRATFVP